MVKLQKITGTKKLPVGAFQRAGNRAVALRDGFGDKAFTATHARISFSRGDRRGSILVPILRKDRKVVLTLKRSPLKPKPRSGERVSVTLFVDETIPIQTYFRATFFSIAPGSGEYNLVFNSGVDIADEFVPFRELLDKALADAGPVVRAAVRLRDGNIVETMKGDFITVERWERLKRAGSKIIIVEEYVVRGGYTYIVVAGGKDRPGQLRAGARRVERKQGGFDPITGEWDTSVIEPKHRRKDEDRGDEERRKSKTSGESSTGSKSGRGKRRRRSKRSSGSIRKRKGVKRS